MKKLLITISLLLFSYCSIFSQTAHNSIIKKGRRMYQNNKRIRIPQLKRIVSEDPTLLKMVRQAQFSRTFAGIVGHVGVVMIGYPIVTTIKRNITGNIAINKPKWIIAGIGAGMLLIITIPICYGAKNKVKDVIRLYNEGLNSITYQKPKTSFSLETTQTGIGVVMRF